MTPESHSRPWPLNTIQIRKNTKKRYTQKYPKFYLFMVTWKKAKAFAKQQEFGPMQMSFGNKYFQTFLNSENVPALALGCAKF